MKRKALALVGALLVGALGSGLWELMKPLISWFATSSLDIVTLGMESLRNGIYADAATQEYDRVSMSILAMLTGIIMGSFLAITFVPTLRKLRRLVPRISDVGNEFDGSRSEHYSELRARITRFRRIRFGAMIFFVIYLTTLLLLTNRVIYVSRVTANFNRAVLIIAPYTPPQQVALFRSKFSLVTTRAEYTNLISEMSEIANHNHITLPAFSIY